MLTPGAYVELDIEKPAAGGRMLARHDGQIVFVAGAIPGERVRVRIDERRGGVVFGGVADVLVPSADRRAVTGDPACGGRAFAHVAYPRQLSMKQEIVRDAFVRIAKVAPPDVIPAHGSPESGYRMRARLHVDGGRAGFYREASHELCDPVTSGQLLRETTDALSRLEDAVRAAGIEPTGLELMENLDATQRALAVELDPERPFRGDLERLEPVEGVTGLAVRRRRRLLSERGELRVSDDLTVTHPISGASETLRVGRHVLGFFQANRYLLGDLVARVVSLTPDGPLTDLYAGGGLFGLAHAALRRGPVLAVEGDPIAASDLEINAEPYGGLVRVEPRPVEAILADRDLARGSVIVDPPRAGLTRELVAAVAGRRPSHVIYVSCDVATLARDVARFVAEGAQIASMDVFDLFPGTAHVETVVSLRI